MIFVTVGTHEQPMTRLFETLERLKKEGKISDPVFVQSGYTDFPFDLCDSKSLLSYEEMEKLMKTSKLVITHGGPATIMQILSFGKVPVVIPRQHQYKEHVNDHQVDFCKRLEAQGKILLILEMEDLEKTLNQYETLVQKLKNTPENPSHLPGKDVLSEKLTEACLNF